MVYLVGFVITINRLPKIFVGYCRCCNKPASETQLSSSFCYKTKPPNVLIKILFLNKGDFRANKNNNTGKNKHILEGMCAFSGKIRNFAPQKARYNFYGLFFYSQLKYGNNIGYSKYKRI